MENNSIIINKNIIIPPTTGNIVKYKSIYNNLIKNSNRDINTETTIIEIDIVSDETETHTSEKENESNINASYSGYIYILIQ